MRNVFISAVIALGFAFRATGTSVSGTNDGVYVAIAGWRPASSTGFITNDVLRFDDGLIWRPFCNTGAVELNVPRREYGIKLSLEGPDGKEVLESDLGKRFGSRFDGVRKYQDVIHGSSMAGITAQGRYMPAAEFSGPVLPSAAELFQMEVPGEYTLEIQMQMFLIHKDNGTWTRELLRFSPIKIKIEKPPEAK